MERVDFKEVKARVSIASVLGRYHVEVKGQGTQGRADCTLPGHPEKSKGTLSVNFDKNLWKCFNGACPGRKGGNVLDFVALVDGVSIKEAAEKLAKNVSSSGFTSTTPSEEKPRIPPIEKPENTSSESLTNKPLGWEFKADNLDFEHPYILGRISKETARHFGVAAYRGPGKLMTGRVVIPIHNEEGVLLGYAGRALNGQEPRYLLPAGLHKSLVLFNLHRIPDGATSVICVEGYWSVFHLHELGFPAVALMGSTMSPAQEELLAKFEHVTLFLDGDDAGKTGSAEIAARLSLRTFVRQIRISGQPDSLTSEEIKKALK